MTSLGVVSRGQGRDSFEKALCIMLGEEGFEFQSICHNWQCKAGIHASALFQDT
jgi:hypothetical protein